MQNHALLLGGSSGLGLATAHELARQGMHLCIVHRDRRSRLRELEQEWKRLRAYGVEVMSYNMDAIRADKRAEICEALAQHLGATGRLRVLVHSIAKGNLKPMLNDDGPALGNDDFGLTIEAMATSLFDWVKDCHGKGLFANPASVISFTSEGNKKAWRNYAAVSAAKAALEAITRNIALEFAPFGIRANCVQAGTTNTPSLRMIPGHEQLIEHSLQRNPFGRLTQAEDVAKVVGLLVKDEALWINGAVIPVDGGEHMR
ncbi:MAG: SDR family oxidoreductase [Bacteroidota bacterium]